MTTPVAVPPYRCLTEGCTPETPCLTCQAVWQLQRDAYAEGFEDGEYGVLDRLHNMPGETKRDRTRRAESRFPSPPGDPS